jgi:hypothetical protein
MKRRNYSVPYREATAESLIVRSSITKGFVNLVSQFGRVGDSKIDHRRF